jgi:hypothetical protein
MFNIISEQRNLNQDSSEILFYTYLAKRYVKISSYKSLIYSSLAEGLWSNLTKAFWG